VLGEGIGEVLGEVSGGHVAVAGSAKRKKLLGEAVPGCAG
jgi:hypothetical protein